LQVVWSGVSRFPSPPVGVVQIRREVSMQISATSTAYGGGQAQRLLNQLLQTPTAASGQDLPGETASVQRPSAPPLGPPASGGAGFTSGALSGLLSTQEASPADDAAGKLLDAADTDGDGTLSLEEIQAALGANAAGQTDALTGAIAQLDTDGDSKLGASELSAGIKAHHAHHGHHAAPPASADLAAAMIGDVDTDGDGSLSAGEVRTAIGGDGTSADGFASAFGKLDTDGDGQLTPVELTAALDTFRATQAAGGAAGAVEKTV
jgi:Ca2+-binding EF-hand superfamily protein